MMMYDYPWLQASIKWAIYYNDTKLLSNKYES